MKTKTWALVLVSVSCLVCLQGLFVSVHGGQRAGAFQWPLDPVDSWTLSGGNDFSTFSLNHSNFYHTGMDLRSPIYDPKAQKRMGRWREYVTPVRAAADGIVVGVFSTPDTLWRCGGRKPDLSKPYISPSKTVNRGLGNVVVIEHSGLYYSLYGHLDCISPRIHMGVKVDRGEIIGKMGCSTDRRRTQGVSPHLHFEIKVVVRENPSEDELLGDPIGGIYWGYTPDLPMGYGFRDPRELIMPFNSRKIPPTPLQVVTRAGINLYIRSGPGWQWAVMSRLKRGDLVVATEELRNGEESWYRIPLPHTRGDVWGWIAGRHPDCPMGRCLQRIPHSYRAEVLKRVKVEPDPSLTLPSVKIYDKLYEVYRDVYLWPGQYYVMDGSYKDGLGCRGGYTAVPLPNPFNPMVPPSRHARGWVCSDCLKVQ